MKTTSFDIYYKCHIAETAAERGEVFDQMVQLIIKESRLHFLTGAGISRASGIQPYRGEGSSEDMVDLFTAEAWQDSPEKIWSAIARLTTNLHDGKIKPNPAHLAIARLEQVFDVHILTQNADSLHQLAGSSTENIIEIHGSAATAYCQECKSISSVDENIFKEKPASVPACTGEICDGRLKPNVTLSGEDLDRETVIKAIEEAKSSRLMVAVGTTAIMPHIEVLYQIACDNPSATTINIDPSPNMVLDRLSDFVVRAPAEEVLPVLTQALIK